jgi:hypothetical protein
VNQAIKFYIDEMIPKLKEIQQLKYDVNLIEFDNTSNEYKLIQYPNSLENQEYYFESDDKVIKFVKGVKKTKTNKTKTLKDTSYDDNLNKKKTRKNKPVTLVIEDEVIDEVGEESKNEVIDDTVIDDKVIDNEVIDDKVIDNEVIDDEVEEENV